MNCSFKFLKKMKSRKLVTFRTSYIFFWGGVSQFWAKRLTFFSFSPFYPPPKGPRDLKIKAYGVIFHGESDFRWIIYLNFWKKWKVQKSSAFVSPKIPKSKKSTFFFEKSMLPLKELRIFLRSFPLLNDQDRSDSVFFGNGRRRTYVIERSESERSEVRAKRGPSEAR